MHAFIQEDVAPAQVFDSFSTSHCHIIFLKLFCLSYFSNILVSSGIFERYLMQKCSIEIISILYQTFSKFILLVSYFSTSANFFKIDTLSMNGLTQALNFSSITYDLEQKKCGKKKQRFSKKVFLHSCKHY